MKNIFCAIFTISYLVLQPVWGSSSHDDTRLPMDDSEFRRAVIALRDNPAALRVFLTQVVVEKETIEPPAYALNHVLAKEQIRLSADDIVGQDPKASNLEKVFYVDLSKFNFNDNPNRQKVLEYFDHNTLYNLRYLNVNIR